MSRPRGSRKRRTKNAKFVKDDIVISPGGKSARLVRFGSVPFGCRVAFLTFDTDMTEPNPKCFSVPVDELKMAGPLEQIAWNA